MVVLVDGDRSLSVVADHGPTGSAARIAAELHGAIAPGPARRRATPYPELPGTGR